MERQWSDPEELARRYGPAVFRLAYARTGSRPDAEDVMQEVFLRLLRARPTFSGEEHAKAWLLRVAVNCANDLFRAPWRKREEPLTEANCDYIYLGGLTTCHDWIRDCPVIFERPGSHSKARINILYGDGRVNIVRLPDTVQTVTDLLGVRHNYVFPLGESLLGPVSPERLSRTPRQERMIASYTLNHSRYTLLPSRIRVMEKPYPALRFGETLYPFYLNRFGIQDLPEGDMYLLVPLGINKQPRRMRMVRMPADKAAGGLEYYLLFGKMNRYLRPLAGNPAVPEDWWGLFVVKHGKILFDVKPRMDELSLEY